MCGKNGKLMCTNRETFVNNSGEKQKNLDQKH